MTPEKDAALCSKYPKIFKNRSDRTSGDPIAWGIECGDGWYDLLDSLCFQIQQHVDWTVRQQGVTAERGDLAPNAVKPEEELQATALQVKEKFGGLRFYQSGGDAFVDGLVRMAESFSYHVCEDCGATGKKRSGSWIRVQCDGCHGGGG